MPHVQPVRAHSPRTLISTALMRPPASSAATPIGSAHMPLCRCRSGPLAHMPTCRAASVVLRRRDARPLLRAGWHCWEWKGFDCWAGGWGVDDEEQIHLLALTCEASCGLCPLSRRALTPLAAPFPAWIRRLGAWGPVSASMLLVLGGFCAARGRNGNDRVHQQQTTCSSVPRRQWAAR